MIIALLGGFLIITFTGFYLANDYQRSLLAEQERLRILTATVASRTQLLIGRVAITLKILDEWCARNPEKDPRFDPEFNALIEVFRNEVHGKIEIRMVTDTGALFFFPSKDAKPLAFTGDREYFLAIRDRPENEIYFSAPIIGRVTGKPQIPISYRVRKNKANAILFFAAVTFESLDDEFADLLDYPERSISIIRKDRMVLYRDPFNGDIVGKPLNFTPSPKGYDVIDVYAPRLMRRAIFYQELDGLPLFALVADSYARMQRAWLKGAALKALVAIAILAGYLLLNARLIKLLGKNDEMQAKLEVAARFDGLTGLKNRQYFFERVTDETERAHRSGNPITFAIADIDHFKDVNDGYGHPAGDNMLKKIATAINANVREYDILGRIGGEEFAILFSDTGLSVALDAANRIRESVRDIAVGTWHASLSIGLVEWQGRSEPIDSLVKRADDALYAAKKEGRNRVIAG